MRIKTALLLCGAAALTALAPVAASAQSVFSFSIGSGYGGGYQAYYPTYGYSNQYGYGGYGGYSGYGRHEQQHDYLDEEHADVHDQLEEEHAQAHAQGLDPYEHSQLHQQLEYQHEYADQQIERQHEYQHRLEEWRQRNAYYNGYRY